MQFLAFVSIIELFAAMLRGALWLAGMSWRVMLATPFYAGRTVRAVRRLVRFRVEAYRLMNAHRKP